MLKRESGNLMKTLLARLSPPKRMAQRLLMTVFGCLSFVGMPIYGAEAGDPADSSIPGITIENVTVDAQNGAFLNITFASAGQSIAAIQLDIGYESQAIALSVVPGPGVEIAGKSIWTSGLQPSLQRVLIAGPNPNTIPDGVIATLSVQVKIDAPPGLHPLLVSNAIASNQSGNGQFVMAGAGGVTIPGNGVFVPLVLAVANAASYAQGPVAPGQIVVIGGTSLGEPGINLTQVDEAGLLSTAILGTRVFFDGIPAPLLYTTQDQVSAIVPYSVEGRSRTSLRVERQGVASLPFILTVARTLPGIFTLDQSGTGQGAIVNEDGTLNGPDNPAARGSVVSIYGTGEGQTAPPGTDGSIVSGSPRRPLMPLRVSIGGQDADVLYAGSAVNQVSGLLQVNARVPSSITPGASVPLMIMMEGSSQTGVTMAVR